MGHFFVALGLNSPGVTEFRRLSDGAAGGRNSVGSIHNAQHPPTQS